MIANHRVVSYDSMIHGHGSLPSYSQDCWRCVHGVVELASSKQDCRITNLGHLFGNRPLWNWSGIVKTLVLLEHFLCWNTDSKSKKSLPLLSHGLVSALLCDVVPPCATANWTTVLKYVPPRATRSHPFPAYPGFLSVTHGPYFRCFWFLKDCFFFLSFISAFLCLNCVVNF